MRIKFVLLLTMLLISASSYFFSPDAVRAMTKIADTYEIEFFSSHSEWAVTLGKGDLMPDRFMDHSLHATLAWQRREDAFLNELQHVDEQALKASPVYMTYRLLKETLENNRSERVCRSWLWDVNPSLGSWIAVTTQLAEAQPVGTILTRAQALKRWHRFGAVVDAEIHKLEEGVHQGYTAPKAAIQAVLKQVHLILKTSPVASPYYDFALRDGDPVFQTQVSHLIESVIHPALQRYADYLEQIYFSKAREEIGVSALPVGEACYLAKIKKYTTLTVSPDEIAWYGDQQMRILKRKIATLGLRVFGSADMRSIFQLAQQRADHRFVSDQAMLAYHQLALTRATFQLPAFFKKVPTTPVTIKPYPAYRAETGATGEYSPPSGGRAGVFYLNTYHAAERSRMDQEALLFHEVLPGHHLQVALAFEDRSHHSLDKYLWNDGFSEGWAFYAEQLADEMGLYTDDLSRLGMLANASLRAARLVVDTGIHQRHWSRRQAIHYLREHTALSDGLIEGEVDRYIMLPGQATAYMLGKRVIEQLRSSAQAQQQAQFDLRGFHTQLLKHGAVPLSLISTL